MNHSVTSSAAERLPRKVDSLIRCASDEGSLRSFAAECASLHGNIIAHSHPCFLEAIDVAKRYAKQSTSVNELNKLNKAISPIMLELEEDTLLARQKAHNGPLGSDDYRTKALVYWAGGSAYACTLSDARIAAKTAAGASKQCDILLSERDAVLRLTWLCEETVGLEPAVERAQDPDVDRRTQALPRQIRQALLGADAKRLRIFACKCAEAIIGLIANPDPRSLQVIESGRLYAEGLVGEKALISARSEADAAVKDLYASSGSDKKVSDMADAMFIARYCIQPSALDAAVDAAYQASMFYAHHLKQSCDCRLEQLAEKMLP
jgi:hypothetical protein